MGVLLELLMVIVKDYQLVLNLAQKLVMYLVLEMEMPKDLLLDIEKEYWWEWMMALMMVWHLENC